MRGFLNPITEDAKVNPATMAGCPSGQWEQTVNLSVNAYGGSNPSPATK